MKGLTKITRSSKLKLNYANTKKQEVFAFLFDEITTTLALEMISELIYSNDKILSFLPKEYTDRLPYSARVNQLLAKEISSIARSIKAKVDKIPTYEGANLEKYQAELLDKFKSKTLHVSKIGQFNLDSRFVSIESSQSSKEFSHWICVKFPKQEAVKIPIKKTRHMKKLIERGFSLKTNTLRIKRSGEVELIYNKEVKQNNSFENIGIDTGRNKSFIISNGFAGTKSKEILNSLRNKKHGSKNKQSHVRKLKQTYDEEIKQIDFKNTNLIVLEKLTGMKPGKRWGNTNHHWSYAYIQNRISLHAQEHGVRVRYVSPAYTSQDCSKCGHRHKNNRRGEKFECLSCGMEMDADLNAAINILQRGTNSAHYQKTR